jgi:Tol biopolymer transport system component
MTDVGKINLKGNYEYNKTKNIHRISGSGENIWGIEDAFYYVWNKTEGDLILQANIEFEGEGKHEHRKAGWMLRAGLGADDAYVDAVLHGDGLISLQYRELKGGETKEVQSPVKGKGTLRLDRTGDQYTMYVIPNNESVHPVATISLQLPETVYTGLMVCSHDSTTIETAVFSDVILKVLQPVTDEERVVESNLEIINIESGLRRIVHSAKNHFEAPNWSRDGSTLYFNSKGLIYTIPVTGGDPQLINTDFATNCNNDHGLSPDGKELVISHHQDGVSLIYILPGMGGTPRLVTENGPSYWHGWSPDGKTLVYCAERKGQYDVYSIPVEGGKETQLTNTPGLDDGPEYSPDGKYIYFNSVRTGQMKIWRMNADGSDQTQVTPGDNYGDWFAHPSPDNKMLIFVSYDKSVEGHPPNKDVVLRIMPVDGKEPKIVAALFGGQGTINVPSWSPDSKEVAFVSYRLVNPN